MDNSWKLKVGVVGVGKMGLSHLSVVRAHPDVDVVGVCDSSRVLLDVLSRYTGVRTFSSLTDMLARVPLDALVIATPTTSHYPLVLEALSAGKHTFCEKPLTLTPAQSLELAELGEDRGLHTQVGYHNRFVASFQECQRLVSQGVIGNIVHGYAHAEGPVVLKSQGESWRSQRAQGGSCLYDYAAHPIDLLNWCLGQPQGVSGTVVTPVFSAGTDDVVYATVQYAGRVTAQLAVNWSDESQRKMSTQLVVWGTQGKITVDRQSCQVYLRAGAIVPDGYQVGWNVRHTTELTEPGWFYLRGEEYSAQIDHFVAQALARRNGTIAPEPVNSFRSAAQTDEVIDMLLRDAGSQEWTAPASSAAGRHIPAPPLAPGRRRHLPTLRNSARVLVALVRTR